MDWNEKIAEIEQTNSKLDYTEVANKIANLVAIEDEVLADQSLEGAFALSVLASSLDELDKGKAEQLELLSLSRVREGYPHVLLPTLIGVGCFYAKRDELEKASPYFDEAFGIAKAHVQTQKALEKINEHTLLKLLARAFRLPEILQPNSELVDLVESYLRECRAFYMRSENPEAVKEIEAILEIE